jgi:nucleotide-binding universal stress UspA family protein
MNQEGGSQMNIILTTDGSDSALAAVELLKSLHLPSDTSVNILAVADSPHTPRHYVLLQALDLARDQLSSTGLNLSTSLRHGHPAKEINGFADEEKPDLIIMGAKGLRATMGILLGGVTQQVIEHTNWPVLVTRAPFCGFKRILLVIDGSPCSQKALEYLVRFPFPNQAQYQIMHVLSPPTSEQEIMAATWAAGMDAITIRPTIKEELERAGAEEEQLGISLLSKAQNLCKEHYSDVSTLFQRGDAATEILAYAKESHVDLIVAGSRGLSAIGGWILGSVSRKLVHYATSSVLIVKGETCLAN